MQGGHKIRIQSFSKREPIRDSLRDIHFDLSMLWSKSQELRIIILGDQEAPEQWNGLGLRHQLHVVYICLHVCSGVRRFLREDADRKVHNYPGLLDRALFQFHDDGLHDAEIRVK